MLTTWGLKTIDQVLARPSTVKVDASDMTLDGFLDDTVTEHRRRSVVRQTRGANLKIGAPNVGRRHLGFVMYDQLWTETVEVWIDEARAGVAVADGNNQRERLFTLAEPYDFKGGEQVRLVTPNEESPEPREDDWITRGPPREVSPYRTREMRGRHLKLPTDEYRIECIAFLEEPPPENSLLSTFQHVRAEIVSPDGDSTVSHDASPSVRITWVTTWDAKCRVVYWEVGSDDRHEFDEANASANHRALLEDLAAETTYGYRIESVDRLGEAVLSEAGSFTTSPRPVPAGSVAADSTSLVVRNGRDASYSRVPIRTGIPFPKGALASSEGIRLIDPDGEEAPVQARTLGRWPDRSVKWSLLDFQADAPQGSQRAYSIEYGSQIEQKPFDSPLRVVEDEDGMTIETGRLTMEISKSRFAPFSQVLLEGKLYLSASRIVVKGANGDDFVSTNAVADSVEIEEQGPMGCVVRVEGSHFSDEGNRLFRSICRIFAYAGLPYFRLDHTFVNDNGPSEFTDIGSMTLELDVPRPGLGASELKQTHADRQVVNGEAGLGRLEGRIGSDGLEVAVVDFWQQYPKSLASDAGGIEVGICPPVRADDYRGDADEHRLHFHIREGVYRLRQGLSKTHTLYIGRDVPPLPLPTCQAPPEWYCDSGALGEVSVASRNGLGSYESAITQACESYVRDHEVTNEYGFINYGDYIKGTSWGNIEYDTALAMFLQWARSGDFRWLEDATRAALHHRDVDTRHSATDPIDLGGVYRHCVGHTGGYYSGSPPQGGSDAGQFTASHTWVDGFLLHYYLTGDLRSFETAVMAAERWDKHYTRHYDFTNCRISGWHVIHSVAMYQATLDRFYLNAADIVVERVLERQDEDGGWSRMLIPGHCSCDPPRHMGNAGFMVGVLLNGLRLYHRETGDKRVAEAIVRGAEFLIGELWFEDKGRFRYTSCPHSAFGTGDIGLLLSGISYAWRISGKPLFEPVLLRGTRLMMETLDPSGRQLSSNLRAAPYLLHDIERLVERS